MHQINEKGHCSEKFTTDGPVKSLFYYESRDITLTVTESLMLLQHRIDGNGSVTELSKVCLLRKFLLQSESFTIAFHVFGSKALQTKE